MVNKAGVILLEKTQIIRNRNRLFVCKCPRCGNEFTMWSSHFYRGSNGCGCSHYKKLFPRLYSIWTNMKTRCLNPNSSEFEDYGGRGILLCEEWFDFPSFMEWALSNGYQDNLTIDRINNDGNYEPSNCRWADTITQANNKRNNIRVNGVSMRRYCIENGLNYKTEHSYLSRHGFDKWIERIGGIDNGMQEVR